MAAILSTNMASLYAQKNLSTAQASLSTSVQRLSSGTRINSAKDDAAGYGIAESIKGTKAITDQSILNTKNAISQVQTAEGALDVVGKILQRVLTLTTQKTDSTLNSDQTDSINNEITGLLAEISNIKQRTKFQGGTDSIFGKTLALGTGAGTTPIQLQIPSLDLLSLGLSAFSSGSNNPSAFPDLIPSASNNFSFDSLYGNSTNNSYLIDTGYITYTLNGMGDGAIGNGPSSPGLQYDPSGNGDFGSADYIAPGTPYEGFAIIGNKSTYSVVGNATISASNVDNAWHAITIANANLFAGDAIVYHSNGVTNPVDGIVDGDTYYVVPVASPNQYMLMSSQSDAINFYREYGPVSSLGDVQDALDFYSALNISQTLDVSGDPVADTAEFRDYQISIGGSNEGDAPDGISNQIWQADLLTNHYVVLKGDQENGFVTTQYMSRPDESIIRMRMSYTNTTGGIVNLSMMRGTDPDVDSFAGGSTDTINTIGLGSIPSTDIVTGVGPITGKALSLYVPGNGYTHNVAIVSSWPDYNPTDTLAGGPANTASDDAIQGAWDFGAVAAGQTVSVDAYYIAGNDVLANIERLANSSSDSIDIDQVQTAIQINAVNRAQLGAWQNSLSYAIDNMQTLSTNLADGISRIVDTDYAAETSNLTRTQIMQQAATSMLAQANQMPNVILTLLR
jgi:flagellin-like hook-associated protein FlgL